MICQYCSSDVEPIELNGKLFCSNCGLAIGNAPTQDLNQPATPIINGPDTSPTPPAVQEAQPEEPKPAVNFEELKLDSIKTLSADLGDDLSPAMPTQQETQSPEMPIELEAQTTPAVTTEPTIENLIQPGIATTGQETSQPAIPSSEPNSEEIQPTVETAEAETENTVNPAVESTPREEKTVEETIKNQTGTESIEIPEAEAKTITTKDEDSNKEVPVLLDILSQPAMPEAEVRAEVVPEETPKNHIMDETIKNVETLGASGILLDILSDEAVAKAREQEKTALEAAADIVPNLKTAEPEAPKEEKTENPQVFMPKGAKKLKVKVDEKDIPVDVILQPTEVEETPKNNEKEQPAEEQITDTPNPTTETDTELDTNAEEIEPPQNEISEKTETTDKTIVEKEPETISFETADETPSDSDAEISSKVAEVFESQLQSDNFDLPSTKNKKKEKPKTAHQKETKSDHLKNYFSEVISDKPGNKPKTKKKANGKFLGLFKILAFIAFLALTIFTFGYLIWYNNVKLGVYINTKTSIVKESELVYAR